MDLPGIKTDARILGQLLAAQSTFSLFSEPRKMGEFVQRAVKEVPGLISCAVCLPGAERPRLGNEPVTECADCDVLKVGIDHDPGSPCRLSGRDNIRVFPLRTQERHFGFFIVKIEEDGQYAPYEPFVGNMVNGLAVNIERQWQKERLEAANVELRRHHEHLEELVRERTTELEEDVIERKRAEETLRQNSETLRARNEELEQFNRVVVGRELRMVELKQEINELCRRLGEPPRHATTPLEIDRAPGAGPAQAPLGGGGA